MMFNNHFGQFWSLYVNMTSLRNFWFFFLKISTFTGRGPLWAIFSVQIYFIWILRSCASLWYITWAIFLNFVVIGYFVHLDRKMTVNLTTTIEFSQDACFWVLQSVRFHMIYNKSYNHQKFKIMISESIGRFFLTRYSSHATRKQKKGKVTECVIQ